jgi:hypothetical protein
MTNLQRRLEKLEELLFIDQSGLVPHSQKWLEYWKRQVQLYATDQLPKGSLFPVEALQAVIRNTEDSDFDALDS